MVVVAGEVSCASCGVVPVRAITDKKLVEVSFRTHITLVPELYKYLTHANKMQSQIKASSRVRSFSPPISPSRHPGRPVTHICLFPSSFKSGRPSPSRQNGSIVFSSCPSFRYLFGCFSRTDTMEVLPTDEIGILTPT